MKKKTKTFTQGINDGSLLRTSAYLREIAVKAFKDKHYLESAIIYFQIVEFCLRLVINLLAIRTGLSESTMKRLEDEQSFYRLVLFFDMLKPSNIFSQRLLRFNKHRNDFMHELYYTKLPDSLEADLKNFCLEGKDLIHRLLVEVGLREND